MAFAPITNTGINSFYTPVPFGLYTLLFDPNDGFLATAAGAGSDYPQRALVFTPAVLGKLPAFLVGQSRSSIDLVYLRINSDADYIPVSIGTLPLGYRYTSSVVTYPQTFLAGTGCVYVGTAPDTDDFAFPMPLQLGVQEAIQRLSVSPLTPVTLWYESAANTYSALAVITSVTIALNP